jgi:hypothetical protein
MNTRYDPSEIASSRDLRLDLLRGVCLVKMVFDHLWHTPVHVANKWIGFVTGAEGFFFISGAVVGIVYRRRIAEWGFGAARRALLERSAHLYLANLALVFLFLTLEVLEALPPRMLLSHWPAALDWPRVFALDHPYFLHVLPRYVVFVALAPLVLWGLGRGWVVGVLAVGVGLHALRWWGGPAVHVPLVEGDEANFPLLSWQLLFLVGVVLGYYRPRVAALYRRWVGSRIGVLVLCLAFAVFVALRLGVAVGWVALTPEFFALIDRQALGYLRWLNLLVAFTFFFWVTDRFWRPIARWAGGLLLPVGQNALYVFLLHIPLVWGLLLGLGPILVRWGTLGPFLPWVYLVLDCAAMGLLWWMVRRRILFRWIPR